MAPSSFRSKPRSQVKTCRGDGSALQHRRRRDRAAAVAGSDDGAPRGLRRRRGLRDRRVHPQEEEGEEEEERVFLRGREARRRRCVGISSADRVVVSRARGPARRVRGAIRAPRDGEGRARTRPRARGRFVLAQGHLPRPRQGGGVRQPDVARDARESRVRIRICRMPDPVAQINCSAAGERAVCREDPPKACGCRRVSSAAGPSESVGSGDSRGAPTGSSAD